MPKVHKDEKRSEYVKRAVHEMVNEEHMTPKAAVGKAEGMYNEHLKKKKGK